MAWNLLTCFSLLNRNLLCICKFVMYIRLKSNHTTFLGQFGNNLHACVSQKACANNFQIIIIIIIELEVVWLPMQTPQLLEALLYLGDDDRSYAICWPIGTVILNQQREVKERSWSPKSSIIWSGHSGRLCGNQTWIYYFAPIMAVAGNNASNSQRKAVLIAVLKRVKRV